MPNANVTIVPKHYPKANDGNQLAGSNSKEVIRTSKHYLLAGIIRIFNVGPNVWTQSMGGLGSFTVPAFDPENPFAIEVDGKTRTFPCSQPLEISRIFPEGYHIDMNKMAEVDTDGEELARSIIGVGRFQSPSSDLRRFGVFIAEGEYPTNREIREAEQKLREHRLRLVAEASEFFQQGPNAAVNITKEHRDAAVATGNGKLQWVRGAVEMHSCPACGNSVTPEVAICSACRTVLNEEKVKQLRIPGYEYLWKPEPKTPNAAKS